MALKSTVFKATLQVNDVDRGYYAGHALTLARHPSETDERMMVRVLAFALHAHEDLAFGRGLSADDEPDLWRRDPTGAILEWIDVGQPDVKLLRRAAGRAESVTVYCYGRAADPWWAQSRGELARIDRLAVIRVDDASVAALGQLVERTMQLHCTILEGEVTLHSGGSGAVTLRPGEMSFIPTATEHELKNEGTGRCVYLFVYSKAEEKEAAQAPRAH